MGSTKRRKHVKFYISLCPDDWTGGTRISVEEQLEQVEAGIRGYLCFETHEEAVKWGYADRFSVTHNKSEQDSVSIHDVPLN